MEPESMVSTATESAPRLATVKYECEDFRIVHYAAVPDVSELCTVYDERYEIERPESFTQSTGELVSYWSTTCTDQATAKSILDKLTK